MKTTLANLNVASIANFVAVCGPVFEHSPWIAERTAGQRPFASIGALHAALAASDAIDQISFTLPNLHRIPFNLEPFGLKFDNDIYVATDEPHGLITGTITRK